MNVCYITNLPNLNGSNRSMLDMIDGFERRSVEPIVILNGAGPIIEELKKRDIRYVIIHYSPSTNSDNYIKNFGKIILNSAPFNTIAVKHIEELLIKEKVDLVHVNNFLTSVGMEAAYKANIPYICHLRDYVWEDHHRKFLNESRQYHFLNKANKIIAISSGIATKYREYTDIPIEIINDGIKVENYYISSRQILNNTNTKLLLAGRIAPGKGQMDAIRAIEVLYSQGITNLELNIAGSIGDDSYYKSIIGYVKEHGLDCIQIHPFINNLQELRSKCDIGLTCSVLEGLGRVTIENMLSGMLVICSDTGGNLDIVKHDVNGILYEQGSVKSLSEAIKEAVSDIKKSKNLALKGHEEAKKYDNTRYSSRIISIYREVLKQ